MANVSATIPNDVSQKAYVGFKLGSQANLDALLAKGAEAGAVNGCFYLTNDTHRLYIGNTDTSLSPVNQGVLSVTNIADLPAATAPATVGNFYYVTASNILCVSSGGKWVQINAVKSVQSVTDTVVAGTNVATVTTEVAVAASADNINDADKKSGSFNIKGAGSAHVSVEGANTVKVTGDKYALSTANNAANNTVDVKLTSDTPADSSLISIKGGDRTTVSQIDNVITITADDQDTNTDTKISAFTAGAKTGEGKTGFDISITESTYNVKNGDVTGTAGSSKQVTIDPAITYGKNNTQSVKFVNGTATLNVYTKSEVDEIAKELNAMTYRGTVGTAGSAGTTVGYTNSTITSIIKDGVAVPVSVGDTFLVSGDIAVDGKTIKNQSLLIAKNGEEDENGYLKKPEFDIVIPTADTDTTYTLAANGTNSIKLQGSTVASNNSGSISIGNGAVANGASVTTTLSATGSAATLTVKHDTVAQNNTTGTAKAYTDDGISVNAVTGVVVDATGHVTGVEKTSVNIGPLANAADTTVAVSSTNNAATWTTKSTVSVGDVSRESTNSFGLVSESLQLKQATNNDSTPNKVAIDMVWGTF